MLSVKAYAQILLNGTVDARVIGLDDWLVHGNVKVVSADGIVAIRPEFYGFELKSGFTATPRNIETLVGKAVAGDGTPFWIKFGGDPKVVH